MSLVTMMQYRQLNYIPDKIDFKNGLVNYGINPIAEEYNQLFNDVTEMIPNNELGKAYASYKEIRGRQKFAIKRRHQKRSFYPD